MGDRERLAQLEELYALRQKAAGGASAPARPKNYAEPTESIGASIGRAAWNLPMSTAELAKDTMMAPVNLVKAVGTKEGREGLKTTAHQAAEILRGGVDALGGATQSMNNETYNNFADENFRKYGSGRRILRTIADDPAPFVAAAVAPARSALKAIPVGAIPGLPTRGPRPPAPALAPTVAELKTQSRGLYDQAKQAGVVIDENAFKSFATKIKDEMRSEGIDKDLHPKSTAALNRIIGTSGHVELNDLETLRKIAGDASETLDRSDKRLARRIIDGIDDFAQNLQPHQVLAGNAADAVGFLSDARKTWRASARGETIEKAIEKAKVSGGALKTTLDEAYRREFKKLYNNERGISRFTAAQKEAIRKVAYGEGKVQSVLNTVGKIIPTGKMSVLSTGAVGAGAHLLGLPVTGPILATGGIAGLGGKVASARITSRNARRASELARTK